VAHKRAQMMHDVMVESAREPTHDRVRRRIIGRGREDVINAIVKLVAARGKVRAINSVRCLEDQRYAQSNNQMDQHKRAGYQPGRLAEHNNRQNEHVREIKGLAGKKDHILARRMVRLR